MIDLHILNIFGLICDLIGATLLSIQLILGEEKIKEIIDKNTNVHWNYWYNLSLKLREKGIWEAPYDYEYLIYSFPGFFISTILLVISFNQTILSLIPVTHNITSFILRLLSALAFIIFSLPFLIIYLHRKFLQARSLIGVYKERFFGILGFFMLLMGFITQAYVNYLLINR